MSAKDLFVYDGGDGKTVENVTKGLPELDIVPATTLVVKPINTIDACTFMVSAEDEKVFWVADLEGEQETNGLDGLPAAVDIVTEKEIVCIGGEATILKEPQQVVILSVDVTTNLDGGIQLQKRHLLQKDGPCTHTQAADFMLLKVDLPPRALAANF